MNRPKMNGECCGNCKWLAITNFSMTNHNPPRWKTDAGAQCKWPQPNMVLALSITRAYGFREEFPRSFCHVEQTGCPTWEEFCE